MQRQLTALGGVAIFLVVLHHTIDLELVWLKLAGVTLQDQWVLVILVLLHRLGKVAVPLFLFISGGFIAYAARGNPPKLSWQTVQMALRRLFWPCLFWSLAFYILIYVEKRESYDLLGYVKNFATGYPFHFVPLLLFFYAVAIPLTALSRRFGLLLIGGMAIYQVLLIAIEYPDTMFIPLPAWSHYLAPPVLGRTMAMWGVYFPLGLVISLNTKAVLPWLQRFQWPLLAVSLFFYGLDVLSTIGMVDFPLAVHIYPLTVVLLVPLIKRQWIAQAPRFEYLGKRSYGLYLVHLLVIDLAYVGILAAAPGLFAYPLLVAFPVFVVALAVPLLLMHLLAAPPTRAAHRYVFG